MLRIAMIVNILRRQPSAVGFSVETQDRRRLENVDSNSDKRCCTTNSDFNCRQQKACDQPIRIHPCWRCFQPARRILTDESKRCRRRCCCMQVCIVRCSEPHEKICPMSSRKFTYNARCYQTLRIRIIVPYYPLILLFPMTISFMGREFPPLFAIVRFWCWDVNIPSTTSGKI